MIEEFISGYDITNFIVGNKNHYIINETLIALKNGAVVQDMEVMSYKDYIHRDNWYASPTGYISTECIERIKKESIAIAERLETYDIARLDYRVTKNNEIYFLEINTVPAIHQKSQAGAICELMGISFDDFVHAWVSSVTQRISETEPNLFS